MKPLSGIRKAVVSVFFIGGVGLTGYGYLMGDQIFQKAGMVSLLLFVVFFALLILPYWSNDPALGPEMMNQ